MDLIPRYLHAVGFWLAKSQRRDLVAEVETDIRSQIAEREEERGYTLTESEIVDLLRQRGHPMLVAQAYLPQGYLIGPRLWPLFRLVLVVLLLCILLPVYALVIGPLGLYSPTRTAWEFFTACVFGFGAIALVFALLERYPHASLFAWDPRQLPPVVVAPQDSRSKLESRGHTIAIMATSLLFSAAWIYFAPRLDPASVWRNQFWAILLVLLGGLVAGAVRLLKPDMPGLYSGLRLAAHTLSLAVLAVAFFGESTPPALGDWISLPGPEAGEGQWIEFGTPIALLVVFLIVLADAIKEMRRLLDIHRGCDSVQSC